MSPRPDRAVLGVDVGTSSAKVGAYTADGTELVTARREYPLDSSRPGRAEQDVDEVVDATLDAIAEVVERADGEGARVDAVALSTAMHGLVGVDRRGRASTPLLTWADTRAATQARRLRTDHLEVYRRTGTPLHPMSPLAKLAWFHDASEGDGDRAPAADLDVTAWRGLKEHLLQRLTGEVLVDAGNASASGLFALRDRAWDDEALALAGVTSDQLAEVVETTHVVDGLSADAATRTGLPRETPVVVGGTDGALANLGVAALSPGLGAVSIGTSGAVRVVVDEPVTDPDMATFCYVLAPGRWVVGGAISNGGLWLRWLREQLLQDDTTDADLSALAAEVPAGADGVLALPWLTGERAPQWSSDVAATLFGLRLGHGRGHVARAGMEGVAHQLGMVTDAMAALLGDGTITRLRATGGFTQSRVWPHIVADVLDVPLELPAVDEAVAFGAAVLGMVALGWLDDLDDVDDLVQVETTIEPDPSTRDVHATTHERYVDLAGHLAEPLRRLADTGTS